MSFSDFVSLRGVYLVNGQLLFDTGCRSGRVLGQFSVFCNLRDGEDLILH
jgi:hypothetical protein